LTVQVDGKQRTRSRPELRGGRVGVDAVIGLEDVDDDRASTRLRHSLEGRDEGHGRDDDFVTGPQSACNETEPESIEAACNSDAFGNAAVLGKCLFETLDVRAVRKGAAVEEVRDVREQVRLQGRMTRSEIEERDAGMCPRELPGRHLAQPSEARSAPPPPIRSAWRGRRLKRARVYP